MQSRATTVLPLDVIGEAIRRVPAKACIEHYVRAIRTMNEASSTRAAKPAPARMKAAGAGAKKRR